MFISLIFFYSAVGLSFVNSLRSNFNNTSAPTELHRFNNHVLQRRIRALVFPKGAQLSLTPTVVKAILDGRPRGLIYVLEFAVNYNLPDTIEDWKPTILKNKFENKITTSKSFKTSLPQTRREEDFGSHDLNFNNLTANIIQPYLLHGDKGAQGVNFEWKPTKMNPSHRHFEINSNKFYGLASNYHKVPYSRKIYRRNTNSSSSLYKKSTALNSVPAEKFVHDLQSDREREQLHKQFEIFGKMLKINMKKCMHRAICEFDSQLRLQGESVMADIIRIILKIPSHRSDVPTDRGNIFNIHCKKELAISCPYSVLHSFAKMFNVNM